MYFTILVSTDKVAYDEEQLQGPTKHTDQSP